MTRTTRERQFVSLTLSGEIGTKLGAARSAFHRRLRANIKAVLARHGHDGRIRDRKDRIDIEAVDASAVAPLARVFGVRAARAVRALPWNNVDGIAASGEALFAGAVAGRRFAVRPRRVGPRPKIPIDSEDLARRLGARLVRAGGTVDLDHPEVEVRVEVRPDDVLFFDQSVPGPGGLPVGVEGRALALISGGFDSAVAAWDLLRQGVELDFVLCDLAGTAQERPVRELLARLDRDWMGGADAPRLFVVDFRPVVAELQYRVAPRYWQVLLKRLMLRAAESLTGRAGAEALVTGEALGQVSSQTLPNLGAIAARTGTPVLRPLLGRDKQEIIARARSIGTAEICERVTEFCALQAPNPAIRVTAEELDAEQARIDDALVATLAARARAIPRSAFGDALADSPELDHVPEHAAVIDLRSEAEYREWAWPDAIHMPFERALELGHRLPRERAYLFYCEIGLKSAHLAEQLRAAGYEAYSFRGGVRPLRRYADRVAAGAPHCA